MPPFFRREASNPIVTPGGPSWRRAVTFNPAVIRARGKYWMLERAAGGLRPFICQLGLLSSEDGVRFSLASENPVFTPEQCGSPHGSVQDPRIVELEGRYWMTFAYRPYAWSSHPTGVGVPDSHETDFPGVERVRVEAGKVGSANVAGGLADNLTRSGLSVSDDFHNWEFKGWITEPGIDDRNNILFPERIGGRYWLLRRPLETDVSKIWISSSEDLVTWTKPELLARAQFGWENNRIGGSTPPIRTPEGWLVFYHGVETTDASTRAVKYRMGAMLLDLENPMRILSRLPYPLLEPETYYEQVGLYIPNVVFPTACVRDGDELKLYYGACDTSICLAYGSLNRILTELIRLRTR